MLGLSALSGCLGMLGSPDSSEGVADLALSGKVLQQPTNASPGRVEATLATTGDEGVTVWMGPALVLTAPDWDASTVFLEPQSDVGDVPDGTRTDDGCWRIAEDERMAVRATLESYDVRPGSPVTEIYDVYTRGHETECLPAGTHRFEDELREQDGSLEAALEFVIEVAEDNRISIDDATGVSVE